MRTLLSLVLALAGCTTIQYSETLPNGLTRTIYIEKPITDTSIDGFTFDEKASGAKKITLHGYNASQTEALGIVAGSVTEGAIRALKP